MIQKKLVHNNLTLLNYFWMEFLFYCSNFRGNKDQFLLSSYCCWADTMPTHLQRPTSVMSFSDRRLTTQTHIRTEQRDTNGLQMRVMTAALKKVLNSITYISNINCWLSIVKSKLVVAPPGNLFLPQTWFCWFDWTFVKITLSPPPLLEPPTSSA